LDHVWTWDGAGSLLQSLYCSRFLIRTLNLALSIELGSNDDVTWRSSQMTNAGESIRSAVLLDRALVDRLEYRSVIGVLCHQVCMQIQPFIGLLWKRRASETFEIIFIIIFYFLYLVSHFKCNIISP